MIPTKASRLAALCGLALALAAPAVCWADVASSNLNRHPMISRTHHPLVRHGHGHGGGHPAIHGGWRRGRR